MNEKAKHLLFLLMRDHIPVGTLRGLMAETLFDGPSPLGSDPNLAAIAEGMVLQLEAAPTPTVPTHAIEESTVNAK